MKNIIAKGIENVVDALGNKIGALPSPNELYRFEKPKYSFPNEGAVFYSPDKTYAELYKADESILRTTKMPDSILDIRDKDSLEKSYNWIKKEISNLEKNEIPNTKQDFELAKKFLEQKDAKGISSSLANLNMIYMKQSNRPLITGMAEKKLMNDLDVEAMTIREFGRDGEDYSIAFRENPYGALPQSFNDLRKGATIRIDNPPFLDAITGETYIAKKIRENNEYKASNPSNDPIGLVSGITGFADNVKFSPQELINIKGHAEEEKYRMSGPRLESLKKSIKEKGYQGAEKGGDRILIHVREDGVPFITEGNHRMVEAYLSNRPFIAADVRYLRGSENVDGPLNPKRIGIDFGEDK
jgi:hypothetical protein